MNSENTFNTDVKQIQTTNLKSNRKIYNRDDFFRYYYCPQEAPDYLKDFQYLYNNFTDDNWCKKPIPRLEIPDTKTKSTYPNNKLKGRQRTLSNQSSEYSVDFPENYTKQRTYTGNNGKFSRYGSSPKEMLSTEDIKIEPNKFINTEDFVDNTEAAQWHKVESRPVRAFNSSKPYAQNIHLTENHWKKWTKDTNQTTEKNRPSNAPFNRQERGNNVWVRRTSNETESRQRNTKGYGRHSVSKSGDQTEDIWQDDWDTEMKSEIAKEVEELILDSYEFPKSSVLPITPPPLEPQQNSPIFDQSADSLSQQFDLWYYRDLSDIERGPFSSENMVNWLATGYFIPSTFVRRACDERFLLLAEYRALYGRIPFTAGPAVPPILANTPIEIDVKQLLIGVETNLIQQVIGCATTLPTIVSPQMAHNNPMRVEENIQMTSNAVEMMAILEEKRILEESRAELERERERMLQEQVQWRERIEAELKAKMEEMILQQTMVNSVNVETINATVDFKATPEVPGKSIQPSAKEASHHIIENVSPEPLQTCVNPEISPSIEVNTKQIPSEDKWEIDIDTIPPTLSSPNDENMWFSKKDQKHQRQHKKSKPETKSSKDEKESLPLPEAKHPDQQPTDSRISFISRDVLEMAKKENVESKGRPIRFELDNHRYDSGTGSTVLWNTMPNPNIPLSPTPTKSLLEIQAEEFEKEKKDKIAKSAILDDVETKAKAPPSWNQSPLPPSSTLPTAAKSLLEIQAEESAKEKRQQKLQNAAMAQTAEASKVSSFKESLLKSSKLTKQPSIPVGKSIWDMIPTGPPTTPTSAKPVVQTPEPEVKKNVSVKSSANIPQKESAVKKPPVDTNSDQLTDWCVKKLAKFSDKFDIHTVTELLKLVPNDEVMELALQFLDDSKFISNFAIEFINKRQELADRQTEDSWQTVKKPITATPVNISKAKTAKSKSKKKMVVIDTKFR